MSDELRDEIGSTVESLGFSLVELKSGRSNKRSFLTVVVYSPAGVSAADLEQVAKTVQHHPAIVRMGDDMHMEVCSPGISRRLRDAREFSIFAGRGVRLLVSGQDEWIGGMIVGLADNDVLIDTGGENHRIKYADVRKAVLDHTQEVRG